MQLVTMGGKTELPTQHGQATEIYINGYKCRARYFKAEKGELYFNVDIQAQDQQNPREPAQRQKLLSLLDDEKWAIQEEGKLAGLLGASEIFENEDEDNPTHFQIEIKLNKIPLSQKGRLSGNINDVVWRSVINPLWKYLNQNLQNNQQIVNNESSLTSNTLSRTPLSNHPCA